MTRAALRDRVLHLVAAVSTLLLVAGLGGTWWWWGEGFDEAGSLGMASPSTDAAMVASFQIAIAGVAGLLAVGLMWIVIRVSRRRRA